jgi:DNA-binding NarL/FixJ family response regulator
MVVDDHDMFRRGLRQLLTEAGVDVVAEVSNGHAAVRMAGDVQPDVVLMDLNMPGMNGIEATRAIGEVAPASRVLMLTINEEDEVAIEALLAGAVGYLLKDAPLEEIVAAIQAAADGHSVVSPRVLPEVLRRLRAFPPARTDSGGEALTPRELDVLRLMVEGQENADIAGALFISVNTVKHHVASIFAKLPARNRLDAAVQAVRRGLI